MWMKIGAVVELADQIDAGVADPAESDLAQLASVAVAGSRPLIAELLRQAAAEAHGSLTTGQSLVLRIDHDGELQRLLDLRAHEARMLAAEAT